jgi:hypothetical protein
MASARIRDRNRPSVGSDGKRGFARAIKYGTSVPMLSDGKNHGDPGRVSVE